MWRGSFSKATDGRVLTVPGPARIPAADRPASRQYLPVQSRRTDNAMGAETRLQDPARHLSGWRAGHGSPAAN